mgnify:CR=1 FL=1
MKEKLIALGLTAREADAYIALYNFEETTATQLAKITKEHRTNIYDSLRSLIKKGLIAYTIKNNVTCYRVSDPENLVDYTKEKEYLALTLLPELREKLQKIEEKPVVEVYEGKEGFISLLHKIIRVGKPICAIAPSEEWAHRFPLQLQQYYKEREKNKIPAKLLYIKGTKIVYKHNPNL